jgi:glycosyltransferase involved in cell wall biosynthesis
MEPWIDTAANRPGAVAADDERSSLGISWGTLVVSVVGRLTTDLEKLDGVLSAMDVVAAAHRGGAVPWRLLVVGDGPGLTTAQEHARAVNEAHGAVVVSVLGARLDPRGAYACADIVLGMGSSALKGMAFGKPLVVQGARGYWQLLDAGSADTFLDQGFYGCGPNRSGRVGHAALARELEVLAGSEVTRRRLGALGRRLVEGRFSLTAAVACQTGIYETARSQPPDPRRRRQSLRRTAVELAKFKVHRSLYRRLALPVHATAEGAAR